jgi:hypothetical protein
MHASLLSWIYRYDYIDCLNNTWSPTHICTYKRTYLGIPQVFAKVDIVTTVSGNRFFVTVTEAKKIVSVT